MLIPMMLARPAQVWRLAAICAVMSVLGGLFGYVIGMWAFAWIEPWIESLGYSAAFAGAIEAFDRWGFWFILAAGFSPIPYKVFTIAAGVAAINLPLFVVASIIGRGARFFLVASLIVWGGDRLETTLQKHVERIGWAVVALVVVVIAWLVVRG